MVGRSTERLMLALSLLPTPCQANFSCVHSSASPPSNSLPPKGHSGGCQTLKPNVISVTSLGSIIQGFDIPASLPSSLSFNVYCPRQWNQYLRRWCPFHRHRGLRILTRAMVNLWELLIARCFVVPSHNHTAMILVWNVKGAAN